MQGWYAQQTIWVGLSATAQAKTAGIAHAEVQIILAEKPGQIIMVIAKPVQQIT